MNIIKGGVTAAKGFKAAGCEAQIKYKNGKKDMALVYSEKPCVTAGTFTTNKVFAAPVKWDRNIVYNEDFAQAVVVNSGVANTCTGVEGDNACAEEAKAVAKVLNVPENAVLIGSTGVIGQKLPIEPIANSIPELVSALSKEGATNAAEAIMTTDLVKKEYAVETEIGGKTVYIGGIAKGSGMIHPNMATMLCFITTDAAISADMLKIAVKTVADKSFNMVSVDGDTSTNDTLAVMASGLAGNAEITEQNEDYNIFVEALTILCRKLSKEMAKDGEGASKLLVCKVSGAKTEKDAKGVAKSVVCSSLLKAAMFGSDANWGRILCALGYAGVDFDPVKVDISLKSADGVIEIVKDGIATDYSEDEATKVLSADAATADIDVHNGVFEATAWGCDLTHDYVTINADYRS